MRKKPGRLRRFLSLNQHRKRWGAKAFSSGSTNWAALKETIIDAGDPIQTRGSHKAIERHLESLRREFSGQSELLLRHAELIVLIRRAYDLRTSYAQFRDLWFKEGDFLREKLNIRWLVSATDTFADHDPDMAIRAVAMLTSSLAITIKMSESERYLTHANEATIDQARVEYLQHNLVPLFEGLSGFTVGTDDTLRNMVWRMEPFMKVEPVGPILREVWERFQNEDTVFARFRALHVRDRTSWWS